MSSVISSQIQRSTGMGVGRVVGLAVVGFAVGRRVGKAVGLRDLRVGTTDGAEVSTVDGSKVG